MNNAELAEAIEKHLILEVLESDPNLVNTRVMRKTLDRLLSAWRSYSIYKSRINLEPKTIMGKLYKAANKFVTDNDTPIAYEFDEEMLEWFDGVILSLTPEQVSLVRYEVFNNKDRDRANAWAKQWGYGQRTYYNRWKETREQLVVAIINNSKITH